MSNRKVLTGLGLVAAIGFALPGSAGAQEWSPPERIIAIGTEGHEIGVAISPDNLSLFVSTFRSLNIGGEESADIWVAKRPDTKTRFSRRANLGWAINTQGFESAPTFSRDGHWMYWCSNTHPGYGGFDIFRSYRADPLDNFAWGAARNMGPIINTEFDECDPYLFEDPQTGDRTLYFAVRGDPSGLGDWDIYSSTREKRGPWQPRVLESVLSTPERDFQMTLKKSGLEIIFTSNREGSVGGFDLWSSTRGSRGGAWNVPVNLGPVVNTEANERGPSLAGGGTRLYFTSDPFGPGLGDVFFTDR